MDELVKSLGPAFAAGLAVQRLLELLDVFLEKLPRKKLVAAGVSLVAGVVLAAGANITVLEQLGVKVESWVDVAVTALIVSAGTEGFNSLVKFLGYAKEAKKTDAAVSAMNAGAGLDAERHQLQRTVG